MTYPLTYLLIYLPVDLPVISSKSRLEGKKCGTDFLERMEPMERILRGKNKTFSGGMSSPIFLKHLFYLFHLFPPSYSLLFCFLFYCFLVIWYIYLFQMLSQIVADIGSHIPRRGDVGTAAAVRPEVVVHSTTTTSPTTYNFFRGRA